MTGQLVGKLLREDGSVYIKKLHSANTWWSRFRGLQFLPELAPDCALLMQPCSSVHTFWMRFPINIIFLDASNRVVECRETVVPWRVVVPRCNGVYSTLEVPIGQELPEVGETLTVASI